MTSENAKRHVLVVHPGGLGDLVLLSELIASLKQADPERALTLICRNEFKAIVTCYPVPPDEVVGLPFQPYACAEPTEELFAFLESLRLQFAGRRVEVLVAAALRPNWLPEFLAAAFEPAVSIRCGVGVCPTGLLRALLEKFGLSRQAFRNLDLPPATHERDRYRLLAEALESSFVRALPWSLLQPGEQAASHWLQSHGLDRGRFVVCAPFGAPSTAIKRWPMESFTAVLRRFFAVSQWPVLLMGDQTENESLARMKSLLSDLPTLHFAGGPQDLPLAAGILSMAGAYLSNDAGLMHLAQAFEVPGAAIFGGGGEWPAYAPWARGSVGLCNPLPCFGCRWDCFLGHGLCVESIPVQSVLDALCSVYRERAVDPSNLILKSVGEPLLGLLADSSARYRESEKKLSERLEVIVGLEHSLRQGTARESELRARLAEAETRAQEMERVAIERLTVLERVHQEAGRRLDLIHEISREAEARRKSVEELSVALAQSEATRLQLEQTIAPQLPGDAERGATSKVRTHLLAELVGHGEPVAVPLDEIVARVTAGEVIILRRCLQELDYYDTFQSIIRNVFEAYIGADKTQAVMARGLQWLHLYVSSSELTEITKRLQIDLAKECMLMVKKVARNLLGVEGDAYAEEARNVRIFVPQDSWVAGREDYLQFERERNRGKLTLHGPHTDVWGYHPLNVINVWTAIGPVLEGNGMSIWPDLFGQIPPMGEWHVSRTDQVLGKPFGVSLNAGDALLFHIGHIHGSRINQTEQTRFVCSARFTVGKPVLFDKPWYSYMHIDEIPDRIGAVVPPCATETERPAVPASNIDTSNRLPATVASRVAEDSGTLVFNSCSLGIGEVRPLNEDYCVARTEEGVFAFSRRCPHEGGDLAAGYLKGARIHCPGHDLGIDLKTGRSLCQSLPPIEILSPVESGDTIRIAGLPRAVASSK